MGRRSFFAWLQSLACLLVTLLWTLKSSSGAGAGAGAPPKLEEVSLKFVHIIEALRIQIIKNYLDYTIFNLILDADSQVLMDVLGGMIQKRSPHVLPTISTYLITNLHRNVTTDPSSTSPQQPIQFKHPAANLIVMPAVQVDADETTNDKMILENLRLPGTSHLIFFLFVVDNVDGSLEAMEGGADEVLEGINLNAITAISDSTTTMEHVLIAVKQMSGSWNMVTRTSTMTPNNGEFTTIPMDKDQLGDGNDLKSLIVTSQNKELWNWNGEPMYVTTCAICGQVLDYYLKSGHWIDPMTATVHELAMVMNATLELSVTMDFPRDFPDATGTWDQFTQPLVEGTAVLAHMMKASYVKLRFILFSNTLMFDSGSFIIRRPDKEKFTDLSVLVSHIGRHFRHAILTSIILLFFTLCLVISEHQHHHSPRNLMGSRSDKCGRGGMSQIFTILSAILKPMIDQSSWTSRWFAESIHSGQGRWTMGLWLLATIILSCTYKSKLIIAIALPRHLQVPHTFHELIARPDYKIGAILFTGLFDQFLSKDPNDPLTKASKRVIEYNYYETDCFDQIFETKAACIGPKQVMEFLVGDLLTDVYGEKLYVVSEEYCHAAVGIGVSKSFPGIIRPLNFIINSFIGGGLDVRWKTQRGLYVRAKGRIRARAMSAKKVYYQGKDKDSDNQAARHLVWLAGQILAFGVTVGAGFLVFEIVLRAATHFIQNSDLGFMLCVAIYRAQFLCHSFRRLRLRLAHAICRTLDQLWMYTVMTCFDGLEYQR